MLLKDMEEEEMIKLISWNVNGLRACVGKNFMEDFQKLDADIFCLQETKLQEGQIELNLPGYYQYWNYAKKKGYSGTAVFTKKEPLSVTYGIGVEEHDQEGRVITLEFDDFYMITVYTPNSQNELARLPYRMEWEDAFLAYIKKLDEKKPVIFCGDLNVAHQEIDLKNPKTNRHNAGFTDEERGKMTALLSAGFVDTFRYFYPNQEEIYSWWSYRFRAREKNAGWRIDYFITSQRLTDRLEDAKIHTEIFGSDHCPVELLLKHTAPEKPQYMKFILAAINAKYIHSNPAVYSLAAYARQQDAGLEEHIEIAEYTINQSLGSILADLYHRKPDVIGFSCYIWNIDMVYRLLPELKKLLPEVDLWLGGPEVTYDAPSLLETHSELTGVMIGEGEVTFTEVLQSYCREEPPALENIPGLVLRKGDGSVHRTPSRELTDLSRIPFLYEDPDRFTNRIIYYETSRGCPFRCSYCLSSIDKRVRFRDISLVKKELQFFLDHQVKQVKFVDRTFNCSHAHAMEIWNYIREHDNGITNFHFEIAADLLDDEELELIASLRPGAIQMEIGVQSTNPRTIQEIDRVMDVEKLAKIVSRLHAAHNVHIHLDLIAGLPYEDYDSFRKSFQDVFAMKPEQLQLGFLKVLKGSNMHRKAEEYGIVYSDQPPYEVLFTRWLSYEEILRLKKVEEMVELYYNTNQYPTTLQILLAEYENAYSFFEMLADFYEEKGYFLQTPARAYRYQVLLDFVAEQFPKLEGMIREALTVDYYLRENAKARPAFAPEDRISREECREFWEKESRTHRYLTAPSYCRVSAKGMARMVHLEAIHYDFQQRIPLENEKYLLFDYETRDPLTHAARVEILDWMEV